MSSELPPSDTCSHDPNRQRVFVLSSSITNRALVMAVMEEKTLLGAQKRRVAIKSGLLMKTKKKKKTKQSSLLKKFVDYLKSDSYLFAPLTSSSSRFDFRSFQTSEIKEKPKENDNERLVKKIGDYLMSDSYMFAPLVDSSSISLLASLKGPQEYIKKVTHDQFSRSSIKLKDCNKFSNDIVDQASNARLHEKGMPKGQSLVHKETVVASQTMYQNRRSPSALADKATHHQKQKVAATLSVKSKLGSRTRKEVQ
ncbi:uncharacterized protein LOC133784409 [Humulus lupulus]|uniref:uncharacterized protein LOC133784409 n=1 Tax=Humulus lupulus TaxID=3486 RepID=UPI002B410FF9|nr:uncharacterized protein LOC133784409 [Humulus lupulus]